MVQRYAGCSCSPEWILTLMATSQLCGCFSGLLPQKKQESCTELWMTVTGGGGGYGRENRMSSEERNQQGVLTPRLIVLARNSHAALWTYCVSIQTQAVMCIKKLTLKVCQLRKDIECVKEMFWLESPLQLKAVKKMNVKYAEWQNKGSYITEWITLFIGVVELTPFFHIIYKHYNFRAR